MTSRDFCYWLQGFFELGRANTPGNKVPAITETQAHMIRKHLDLVFVHEIDPSAGPAEHQAKLNAIHNGASNEEIAEFVKRLEAVENRPPQVIKQVSSGGTSGLEGNPMLTACDLRTSGKSQGEP